MKMVNTTHLMLWTYVVEFFIWDLMLYSNIPDVKNVPRCTQLKVSKETEEEENQAFLNTHPQQKHTHTSN